MDALFKLLMNNLPIGWKFEVITIKGYYESGKTEGLGLKVLITTDHNRQCEFQITKELIEDGEPLMLNPLIEEEILKMFSILHIPI